MGIRSFLKWHGSSKSPSETAPSSPTTADDSSNASTTAAEELERVFRKFDSNGDGRISSSELRDILLCLGYKATDQEIEQMMQVADADGDGFISLKEFVDLNTHHADDPVEFDKDLRDAFSVFDLDHSGKISAAELAHVLKGLGETTTIAQCKRMIEGVDRDGDGQINFDEFKTMMAGRAAAAAFPNI